MLITGGAARRPTAPAQNHAPVAPSELAHIDRPTQIVSDLTEMRRSAPGQGERLIPTWWQAGVAYGTRRKLQAKKNSGGPEAELWRQRLEAYDAHVARLSYGEAGRWLLQQAWDLVSLPRLLASWAFFPGQLFGAPRLRTSDAGDGLARTPLALITQDHSLLDGVAATYHGQDKQAGTILVCGGNGMLAAHNETFLLMLAYQCRRNVVMFDYRGFGNSLGSRCTTSSGVRDVLAGLQSLANVHEGPVSVVGISIGAGCAAAALAQYHRENPEPANFVDMFVPVHSFQSLPAAVGGLFGSAFAPLARTLMWTLGFDRLDTARTLRATAVAPKLMVVSARNDRVIPASAALNEAAPTAASKVSYHQLGEGHCDILGLGPLLSGLPRKEKS